MNKPFPKISKDFLVALKKHPWQGNIRELKNVIERSLILCDKELLPEYLPFDFSPTTSSNQLFDLAEVEKMHIKKVMRYTNNNKTESAKLMNIGLTTLYRKLQEYKIDETSPNKHIHQ